MLLNLFSLQIFSVPGNILISRFLNRIYLKKYTTESQQKENIWDKGSQEWQWSNQLLEKLKQQEEQNRQNYYPIDIKTNSAIKR